MIDPTSDTAPLIGILAGMGPRSTTPFLERVLDECVRQYGAVRDDDFPPMMIHSLPTPFTLDAPLDHDAMRAAIRSGLQRLLDTGVAVVAMPCNVAHLYYNDLVAELNVPLLHLIEITAAAFEPDHRTTVLATRHTIEAGLYQEALRARGVSVADPAPYRDAVDALIGGVKASRGAEELGRVWDGLVADLRADGVESVALGSTDLSAVAAAASETRLGVVDSAGALAAALVEHWRTLAGQVR